ncbi:hypothetical protein GYMLUDRAFT_250310 [Collybiopsis luxurians FD-317 M1]|uniref:Unplaced genomic scaffold GYMLUscaffold_80, whole genome shotgun sequence n=1 Tax=Collybiopsis luxurians FD-317 M1 TaxID=944289 RepID=A0A0D0ASU3_9AGAR|nr:hypothetical protein GYMLUDRAFT_250310 [Collybiopsis luxurians FD-317 M1]
MSLGGSLIVYISFLGFWLWFRKLRNTLPYPPGPEPHILLGNLKDVPVEYQWIEYTKWAKKYGDIMHLNILGQHLVIVSSEAVAKDLFEKRSANYSDRPEIGHYGDEWRRDRRVLHQKLRSQNAEELHPLELSKAHELLRNLLDSPMDFENHFQVYPASVVIQLLYGHEVTREDPLINLVLETIWLFSGAVFPGTNLLNVFPSLKHIPEWLPVPIIQPLLQRCAKSRALLTQMQDIPFNFVKRDMEQNATVQCWISELLEKNKQEEQKLPESVIKAMGASLFAAATETVLAVLSTFVLAMILFPDVQKQAQQEIDLVVGNSRLPTFEDRPSLPYLDALIRELFRWHGPAPLGIPHAVISDDIYNGYFIPKGATIVYNHWAMWRDQQVYQDPEVFNPKRFLDNDGQLTGHVPPTYGFGRRICIGRSMGDATVWIAIVLILAVFDIKKARDKFGKEIEVHEQFTDGVCTTSVHLLLSPSNRKFTKVDLGEFLPNSGKSVGVVLVDLLCSELELENGFD